MHTSNPPALERAIAMFPNLRAFSSELGVGYQVVQQWRRTGVVPAGHCPEIEKITGRKVKCEELNDKVDWAYVRKG